MSDQSGRTHALAIVLEDRLITFTRAVGLLRRRHFEVRSIAVGPSAIAGFSRLIVMLEADQATANRAALHLQKVVGVREAAAFAAAEGASRELALIKVRVPPTGRGDMLDVAQLYRCTVVDEAADVAVLEVSGPEPFVRSCLGALQRFEILEVARTGPIALDPAV